MSEEQLSMFDELTAEEISLQDMDDLVVAYYKARMDYEQKKLVSTEAYHHMELVQEKVMGLLKRAGKKNYSVDGVGRVQLVDKLKVKFPTDPTKREAFFKWLEEQHGKDTVLAMTTVNYQALNSFYTKAFEESVENGTADDFTVPGIDAPETETEMRFNKARS